MNKFLAGDCDPEQDKKRQSRQQDNLDTTNLTDTEFEKV